MKRNIAFFISTNKKHGKFLKKAQNEILQLAKTFNHSARDFTFGNFYISIIFQDELSIVEKQTYVEFPIGNLGNKKLENDRFLKIKVLQKRIEIINDYAGAIPVYYSCRKYLSLSNIEPCVVIDSKASSDDFSYENIYGFMRYMHFIWDETAYKHIYSMLPDSLYKFDSNSLSIGDEYLATVKSSKKFESLSDAEVSYEINKLNDELVYASVEKYEQIILPLSSGYDSRMILASLSKRADLKKKLHCFTYGSQGSIEVKAARRLTKKLGVKWDFIDLPLQFLSKEYLHNIHNIFGSSLHMHGMYQLEFFNEISKKINIKKKSCLTSGFMTGVPAGQHNSLLEITNNKNLAKDMGKFPQSTYWSKQELEMLDVFKGKGYEQKANARFQLAFDRFDGEIYQQAVMFDVWTRQRNFIGYYPRVLEWKIPTVSPHMNPKYANFFLSLSEKHLNDRFSVELMFAKKYPNIASIASNSNGLNINNYKEYGALFISRVFKKFKISWLLPKKYANADLEFNIPSVRYSKKDALYPLLSNIAATKFINSILSSNQIEDIYKQSYNGSVRAYEKLIVLQSVALSLLKMDCQDEP